MLCTKTHQLILFILSIIIVFLSGHLFCQENNPPGDYVENRILIKFKTDTGYPDNAALMDIQAIEAMQLALGVSGKKTFQLIKTEVWDISLTVQEALNLYQDNPLIEYMVPDRIITLDQTIPSDPDFPGLWGLHNTGQDGGTPDADIDAPEAWDMNTGGPVIIAVIDSGIDYTHEDLAANIWQNEDEVPGDGNGDGYPGIQGVDDDGDGLVDEDSMQREPGDPGYTNDLHDDDDENGYPDDFRGWNFVMDTNDPIDTYGHGTHCAGTIGAVANNGTGVTGINWHVRLMPIKFLEWGWGTASGAIRAIEYAIVNDAKISSNSWTGKFDDPGLREIIGIAQEHGHLFIAAAGNSNSDNDTDPHFPASYPMDNIISVAATDRNDMRVDIPDYWGSNYGAVSVDLGAPGSIHLYRDRLCV